VNSRAGIFRIGNAAGEAHPIIGEGMSMAMQSAWVLCWHLLGAGHPQTDLSRPGTQQVVRNRYEADWRRLFARRLRLASVFAHLAMRPFVFGLGSPWISRLAPLLKHGAELSVKVQEVLDPATVAALAAGTRRAASSGETLCRTPSIV
jgi:2-polyprenyl-6-methoxyphenol hydroxylase-like FAD-dependent oxidoreductase